MRITERQIRKIVREMALKSLNIAKAQPMERSEETDEPEYYGSPDEAGMFADQHPVGRNPFSAEEFYSATQKTWGREQYKRYAARQFERFPIGLNVFIVPGAAGRDVYNLVGRNDTERFTDPADPVANAVARRIIEKHFPDVPIDGSDFNILLLTGVQLSIDSSGWPSIPTIGLDLKNFLAGDGVYNTFHALFDGGPLDEYAIQLRNLADDITSIVAPGKAYYEIYKMRNNPMYGLFRVRTLQLGRVDDAREMGNELATVALVRNTVPVRPEEFPTHDINGAEIPEVYRQHGIRLATEMIPYLETIRDLHIGLAGKTVVGKHA